MQFDEKLGNRLYISIGKNEVGIYVRSKLLKEERDLKPGLGMWLSG